MPNPMLVDKDKLFVHYSKDGRMKVDRDMLLSSPRMARQLDALFRLDEKMGVDTPREDSLAEPTPLAPKAK